MTANKSQGHITFFPLIAALVIVVLLVAIALLANVCGLLTWPVSFFIFRQILTGLVVFSIIALLVLPRVSKLIQTKDLPSKLVNGLLVLVVLVVGSFLLTFCSTLWPEPEKNVLEEFLSNLGWVAGGVVGLYMRSFIERLAGNSSKPGE